MEAQEQSQSAERKLSKISISEEVFDSANRTLKELKKRGSTVRIEDIFIDLFLAANAQYWEDQLQKFTPDDYLLELAKQNPEARLYLIQQAKHALEVVGRGESLNKERKRPGPKPKSNLNEVGPCDLG